MDFKQLVDAVIAAVLKPLTVLIIGLAVLYFLLGVLKYIQSVGDETKRKEGVTMMTYGIIGLFVMASLWGLVYVIQNTFPGIRDRSNTPISPPPLSGSSNSTASTPLNSRASPISRTSPNYNGSNFDDSSSY